MAGALLRAAIVASPLRDGLPPVDLRAVCLVRAMVMFYRELRGHGSGSRLMVMNLEDLWREYSVLNCYLSFI